MPLLYLDAELQDMALSMLPVDEIYSEAARKEFYEKNATLKGHKMLPHWNLMDCSTIAMMS